MKKLKRILLLSVLSVLTLVVISARAQSASDTLTQLLLNITTLQADFKQTVNDKSSRSLQQSEGHFALERPGKFRWEITKPIAQLLVANGSRLWIYDPDLEQVTIRKFSSAAGQTPALLLSDKNLTLGKDFDVKEMPNPALIAGYKIFMLTPKDQDNLFSSIKISFIQKNIREMQIADHLGHVTTITFQNVREGMPLSPALFSFTPPPKVDVIDETHDKN